MDINIIDTRQMIDSMPCGIVVHGPDTSILYANPMACTLLGLPCGEAVGRTADAPEWSFINEEGETLGIDEFPVNRVLETGEPVENMLIGILDPASAKATWVTVKAYAEKDESGEITSVIVIFFDVTEQRTAIPFQEIVSLTSDAVIVTEADLLDDPGPRIVYVNNAFTDISGYTPEEAIGKTPRILQGEDTSEEVRERIKQRLAAREPVREIILNYDKAGNEYWLDLNIFPLHDPFGNVTKFAAIERDVTVQKLKEEELRVQAHRDPLTGLLNRRGFMEQTRLLIAQQNRLNLPMAVLMLDIDHFKRINDTYGHDVGDVALQVLSEAMIEQSRESDVVGRLGGEEFALVLSNTNRDLAIEVAERLRKRVQKLVVTPPDGGVDFSYTVSLGVAASDVSSYGVLKTLLKEADESLYEAKNSGRNRVCCR